MLFSASALLHTKIKPPVVKTNLLPRERLLQSLERSIQGRLTTVCAPAGSGKSTLIGQWAHSGAMQAVWLSLDERDNDISRFWRYVVFAFIDAYPDGLSDDFIAAEMHGEGMNAAAVIDSLLNELAAIDEPVALVLDDYHHISHPEIHAGLAYFIEYLPGKHHVIIASRSDMPFAAAKWQARGERHDIGMNQLQFSEEETAAFCKLFALPLERRHTSKLFERTEGWIAGLQLAAISLRSRQDADRFIDGFGGSNHAVSSYLFQEVLERLPGDIADFLLTTCVFDRMDAEACDHISGRTDSRQLLERLRELNLFLIPLDEEHGWFRYHHLFADFLRNRLQMHERGQWLDNHHKASLGFASRGMLDKAIDHAIAAERLEDAAAWLDSLIPTALKQGELSVLVERIQSVHGHTAVTPNVALFHAFALFLLGRMEECAEAVDMLDVRYKKAEQEEEREQLRSGLLFLQSNLLFYTGRYVQWDSFVQQHLHGLLPENPLFYNYNYNTTEPLVRRTAFGLQGVLSADTERIGACFVSVLERHGWGRSLINLYVIQSMAEGYYEWNRLDDSSALLHKVDQAERVRYTAGLFVPNRLTQSRIHAASGRLRQAHEAINEAERMVLSQGEYHWLSALRACRARLYLSEDKLTEAKSEIAALRLSDRIRPSASRWMEYTAYARILMAQGKAAEALQQLELIGPPVEQENGLAALTEISLVQALAEYQRGNRSAAFRRLQEALAIGAPNGYMRSFIDEGPLMDKLLRAYADYSYRSAQTDAGSSPELAYIAKLLDSFPQQPAFPDREAKAPVEPLTEQENYILQLLGQGAPNRLIAAKLALTEGTVKVYLSRIYAKLGVSSRTQALAAARQSNGIE